MLEYIAGVITGIALVGAGCFVLGLKLRRYNNE